jgi:FkbM family methyltransferase
MIPKSIRRITEFLSRRIVLNRKLPKRFGSLRLVVSPAASLSYYKMLTAGHWHDLYDFAETYVHPNAVVWDVGANMGIFTFSAAYRAGSGGKVLALEADEWSVGLLRRSVLQNVDHVGTVEILQVAISDSVSLQTFHVPERNRAASHLASAGGAGAEIVGGIREKHLVISVSLDWLAAQHSVPNVLKIDVDGAEMQVLLGGEKLIRAHRPIILLEVYERNADQVTKFLSDLGYSLFDFNSGMKGKSPVARAVYNTLALPNG